MPPFFSIVVACCNVEKYVRECLDSIRKQSFADWECLCIVEDSTDSTESIVREFATGDSRFRVFTEPRSGSVAMPRNVGMANSVGEYVVFCDGDDSIAEEALTKIATGISSRRGADIYACAIWEYRDGGEYIRTIDNFSHDAPDELSGHDAVLLLYKYWIKPSPMLQANVWRRNFLKEHHLQNIPGLVWQDSEFFPRALYLAKRIVPLHEPFYRYRRHDASVTMMAHEPGFRNRQLAVIFKSLFAFHAAESKKPGFDRRITECWARLWLGLLYYNWFGRRSLKMVPRQMRWDTLNMLFSNGFDDLKKLAANTTLARRSMVLAVELYLRCPMLAWPIEQFFVKVAFPLAAFKNRKKRELRDF